MYLCMYYCNVRLDNIKYLRRYILQYTVRHQTSLRNVAGIWFYAAHSACCFVQIVQIKM